MLWSISLKTGRELYALHCNLEFSVTPRPPALIIEFGHGKAWSDLEFQKVSHNVHPNPHGDMHTHTVFKLAIMTMLLPKT